MIDLLEKSKYPIIVFEGPDGAGKTTLSQEMTKLLGARYIHLVYRFKDRMHLYHYAAIRLAAHLSQKQPVIIDRWWPSEITYAEAYRGGSKFAKHFTLLEHVANKMGVVYVYCLPKDKQQYLDYYEQLKGLRTKEELDRDPLEGVSKVYDEYQGFYDWYFNIKENVCQYDMFENFNDNEISRGIINRQICQNILEFTEDYRRTI
jgi:thymidylate kinase